VTSGSGPSSNVRATAFLFDTPRLITGRKKLKRGKKGAAAQSRIKPTKGIRDIQTLTNSSNIAISNEPMPPHFAGESGNFPETANLIELHLYD
jgi:hypothetical protein